MGIRESLCMAEKKVPKAATKMGASTRNLEWFCDSWSDLHMDQKFSGIGSWSQATQNASY